MNERDTDKLPPEIEALLKEDTKGNVTIKISHPNKVVGQFVADLFKEVTDSIFYRESIAKQGPWGVDIEHD